MCNYHVRLPILESEVLLAGRLLTMHLLPSFSGSIFQGGREKKEMTLLWGRGARPYGSHALLEACSSPSSKGRATLTLCDRPLFTVDTITSPDVPVVVVVVVIVDFERMFHTSWCPPSPLLPFSSVRCASSASASPCRSTSSRLVIGLE